MATNMSWIDTVLLLALLLFALWSVLTRTLLKSAVGLALASVLLTVLMFQLQAPLAAVFELSVCAGLITVIFISTISLTRPQTQEDLKAMKKRRFKKYWALPVILAILSIDFVCYLKPLMATLPAPEAPGTDVKQVLWNLRPVDILGQLIVLLAGVFGVVVFFKDKGPEKP
jgi:NADH-quinone oxidoreductase subunit J